MMVFTSGEASSLLKAAKFPAARARGKTLVVMEFTEHQYKMLHGLSNHLGCTFEEMATVGAKTFLMPLVRRRNTDAALADCRRILA